MAFESMFLNTSWRTKLAWAALFFAAYLSTAMIGRFLYGFVDTAPTLLWPPAGISVAAVFLGGWYLVPVIPLATFFNLFVFGPASWTATVSAAFSSTIQVLVIVWVLQQFKFNPAIERLRDMLLIVAVAIFLTPIHPVLGSITNSILTNGIGSIAVSQNWITIWLGNMVSVLLITPLITSWSQVRWHRFKRLFTTNDYRVLEAIAAIGVVGSISYFLLWTEHTRFFGVSLVHFQLAALLWIALRHSVRMTLSVIFGLALLAIVGAFLGGHGQNTTETLGARLMAIEQYFIILSIIYGVVAVVYAERKKAEQTLKHKVEELRHALESIQRSERAKTEFIAILAHELRNPLTPIVNYVELIKRTETTTPQIGSWIAGIEANMKSVTTLLNDILDVSRVSERKFKLTRKPFVFQECIENSVRMVEPFRKTKRVRLSISMQQAPIMADMDQLRLEQVFVNLFNNAIKYSAPESLVRVYVSLESEHLIVRVEDEGIGIDAGEIGKLFEPFAQLSTASVQSSGLGIGLFLARSFIELHGGSIAVESKGSGQGSAFTVFLPRVLIIEYTQPERYISPITHEFFGANGITHTPHVGQPAHSDGKRILVVDDKLDAAVSLARLIESEGYIADVANDGAAALKAVQTFHPDTIFLDIRMPGMNGYEVAERLRKEGVTAKIIALTGFGQQEDKRKAEASGFDAHITKPVDALQVFEAIKSQRRQFGA